MPVKFGPDLKKIPLRHVYPLQEMERNMDSDALLSLTTAEKTYVSP